MTRRSGVLLPIFSLPSNYGTGCFSREARGFADKLADAGQSCWQVLPLGPVKGWNSPYQTSSCFAGNPYFIDPDTLYAKGLLSKKELASIPYCSGSFVDYSMIKRDRSVTLRRAYAMFRPTVEFEKFCSENAYWLDDYALFTALSFHFKTMAWNRWEDPIRRRRPDAVEKYSNLLREDIEFRKWTQFEFFEEWRGLSSYARDRGVEFIGDIPFYAAYESSDCWSRPELFALDGDDVPSAVAGCPPDAFSPAGQIWDNPLYNWDHMRKDGFEWWLSRIEHNFKYFDTVRLDHIRGFKAYYSIPADSCDAADGHWIDGPGDDLFDAITGRFTDLHIIAEDLGHITPEVRALTDKYHIPGMKVLQFAFDSGRTNPYLPDNTDRNSVVYTGTHDNDTTLGWWETLDTKRKKRAFKYLGRPTDADAAVDRMIETAFAGKADICMIPMQDHLHLGRDARINVPGVPDGNWRWRMAPGAFDDELAARISALTRKYGRASMEDEQKWKKR